MAKVICPIKRSQPFKAGSIMTTFRFFKKIISTEPEKCWIWEGSRNPRRYGNLRINKKLWLAHRYSWFIHFGEIPQEKLVLHKCDNPPCVNPEHLFLGTYYDNHRDMIIKGRRSHDAHTPYKFNERQVKNIQTIFGEGKLSRRAIARKIGCDHTTINQIIKGKYHQK